METTMSYVLFSVLDGNFLASQARRLRQSETSSCRWRLG